MVFASLGLTFMLIIVFAASTISYLNYISRPADSKAAKKAGQQLLGTKNKTVMMIGSHPDDAEWYTGGTLSMLHKNGNKVIVVVATSGEKGGSLKDLGAIREMEQLKAGEILGYDEIKFLRFKDRELEASAVFTNRLKGLMEKYEPSIILTFDTEKEGYIYRHPDHWAAGKATLNALKDYKKAESIYFFHSSKADTIVDVSVIAGLKNKAMSEHKSQRNGRMRRIFRYLPTNWFRANRDRGGRAYHNVQTLEFFRQK